MKDFKLRLITGILLLSLFTLFFTLRTIDTIFFDALLGVLIIISASEVSRVYIRSKRYNFMNIVSMYPILFLALHILLVQLGISVFLIIMYHVLLFFLLGLTAFIAAMYQGKKFSYDFRNSVEFSTQKMLRTIAIMIYPAFMLSILFVINNIDPLVEMYNESQASLGLIGLILVFAVSLSVDASAYFTGNIIGGKKIAPLISPNKTLSGAIGGLVAGTVASVIIYNIFNSIEAYSEIFVQLNVNFIAFVIYGLFASVACQLGDIFASIIKRDARAKDFSSIFPGHGGVMDRLDSVAFNSVFTLVFIILFLI